MATTAPTRPKATAHPDAGAWLRAQLDAGRLKPLDPSELAAIAAVLGTTNGNGYSRVSRLNGHAKRQVHQLVREVPPE